METFILNKQPHITLDNLLKVEGWCESGGFAKQVIADGQVRVNGQIELRKRCKITSGQVVEYGENKIRIENSGK